MIAFVRGTVEEIRENTLVVGTQSGIGYEIYVPASVFTRIGGIGQEITLYTYLQVKEDGVALFGFSCKDDLNVFKLLITVNGIGPKGAISILSSITADDLRFAVLADDVKAISKAPGIGSKTAGKLILELKDKFKLEDAFEMKSSRSAENVSAVQNRSSESADEAVQAMIALGYSSTDALKAVRQVELTEDMTTQSIIKKALQFINR